MKRPSDFSLAAMVRACVAGTWRNLPSDEFMQSKELEEIHGKCTRGAAARLPPHALQIHTRDMTVAGFSGSNYLVGTEQSTYLPALQPASVVLKLGAQTLNAGPGHVVMPNGASVVTTQWLSSENDAMAEVQPSVGQTSGTPRILAALIEVSHQMLSQSNAEQILRTELIRAAGAAIDAAALAGTGTAGQPLGIVNTPNVGTFTGGTLNRSALTNAQLDVGDANAVVSGSVGYVTTPTVANTLANRADTIESTRALWQGPLHEGTLIGTRALSTKNCPSATGIYADWANLTLVSWGAPEIAVNPMTKFNQGIVQIRLLLMADVVVQRAAGFSVATPVS